jgi:hypothetical protein
VSDVCGDGGCSFSVAARRAWRRGGGWRRFEEGRSAGAIERLIEPNGRGQQSGCPPAERGI